MHILWVPGARLYYEVEGDGPTPLLIPGGAADSMMFNDVRKILAEYYSVVTYDPRGISFSPLDGAPPEQGLIREHADDVQHLLAATGTEPACVFAHCNETLQFTLNQDTLAQSLKAILSASVKGSML
jgi:pimeloyl-ACP methyl ester carboxylesterase